MINWLMVQKYGGGEGGTGAGGKGESNSTLLTMDEKEKTLLKRSHYWLAHTTFQLAFF